MQVVHFPIELCIVSTYDTFARKNKDTHWGILVFYMIMGFERALRKQAWHVFRPWENLWKADGTPQGVLAAFHFSVHWSARLCIVSTCGSFAMRFRIRHFAESVPAVTPFGTSQPKRKRLTC